MDHAILLSRLSLDFGFSPTIVKWFTSYLQGRRQSVKCGHIVSPEMTVPHGVPQGSVLGPLLFLLYTADVQRVIESWGLDGHFYADDSQILASCHPREGDLLKAKVLDCIDEVAAWMSTNRLKLNQTKTEFIWCAKSQQQQMISTAPFVVKGVAIEPSKSVRLLGVIIDSDLSMTSAVNKTVSTCFYQLRRIRSIRQSLPIEAAKTLVNALVVSRIDNSNGLFAGITMRQSHRLQSMLNASARVIFGGTRRDHITPVLRDKLHWLRFRQRVTYKLCLQTYHALNHRSPAYIRSLINLPSTNLYSSRLRSADSCRVVVPRTRTKFGERGFSVAGPAAWNSLPEQVRLSSTLNAFKKQLKSHLFHVCYAV